MVWGGGGQNFFRGGSKGVGDPLIPGNQSSCIAGGGGVLLHRSSLRRDALQRVGDREIRVLNWGESK